MFLNNQHSDRKAERKTIWTILNATNVPGADWLTPERTKLLAARMLRPEEIEPTDAQCQTVRNYVRVFFSPAQAKFKQVRNTIAGRNVEFKLAIERNKKRPRREVVDDRSERNEPEASAEEEEEVEEEVEEEGEEEDQ